MIGRGAYPHLRMVVLGNLATKREGSANRAERVVREDLWRQEGGHVRTRVSRLPASLAPF